jgi:hypothetical protein
MKRHPLGRVLIGQYFNQICLFRELDKDAEVTRIRAIQHCDQNSK